MKVALSGTIVSLGGLTNLIDSVIVWRVSIDRELVMTSVTVSSKFQIVIPKDVREAMGIVSGQKIQMLTYRNRIELIPIKPMKRMKGFLKGIDTEVERDKDRV